MNQVIYFNSNFKNFVVFRINLCEIVGETGEGAILTGSFEVLKTFTSDKWLLTSSQIQLYIFVVF